MKLKIENIFEQQPATESQKLLLYSYLNNDKNLLGVTYCKLIDYFCLEHVFTDKDTTPLIPSIKNYKNKQYLLQDVVITFKIHESKLNFINTCKSVEYCDLTPDKPVITTWNYYWSNFIDVTLYHAHTGLPLQQETLHDLRLPGLRPRKNYFEKHIQDVSEFDMFANMILGRAQQNNIKVYLEYRQFYDELVENIDPKIFIKTKLSHTIEQKMLIRIDKKIYTYKELKDLVIKRFN